MAARDKLTPPWSVKIALGEIRDSGNTFRLKTEEADRKAVARLLNLMQLPRLEAKVSVTPWFDGVEIVGEWSATVVQTCGVSLEPLSSDLSGEFKVRAVPSSSHHAMPSSTEIDVDPLADDPPDILEGDIVDMAAYVVEHLALEIDPFPRKPDAQFQPPEQPGSVSPFAALLALKRED